VNFHSERVYVVVEMDGAELGLEQAQAVARLYARVLEAMAADPDAHHERRDFLDGRTRERLLREWNPAWRGVQDQRSLTERLAAQVARTPQASAVTFEGRTLTYRQLDRWTNRIAGRLRTLGVGPEVRVALLLERSLEMVAAIVGVLKAGGAYVPIEPSYPQERVEYTIRGLAPPALVLTQWDLAPRVAGPGCAGAPRSRDLHLETARPRGTGILSGGVRARGPPRP
jgi:non-ribosomal peptide synthetase component F